MLFNAKLYGVSTYFLADTEESVKEEFCQNVEDIHSVEDLKPWEIQDKCCKIYLLSLQAVIDIARHVYINTNGIPINQSTRIAVFQRGKVLEILSLYFWQPDGLNEAFEKYSYLPVYTKYSTVERGDVIISKDNVAIVSYRP